MTIFHILDRDFVVGRPFSLESDDDMDHLIDSLPEGMYCKICYICGGEFLTDRSPYENSLRRRYCKDCVKQKHKNGEVKYRTLVPREPSEKE